MIPEIWRGRGFDGMRFGSGVGLEVEGGLMV